jgi:hypothetical protein
MSHIKHGLSIGMERVNSQFFLSLKVSGKLTHQDYLKISPIIDSALSAVKDPEVKAFIDTTEIEGWELRAAWDDLKLGLHHGNKFTRVAIYGNKKWQEYIAKIANWFISGNVKFFDDSATALDWLQEE